MPPPTLHKKYGEKQMRNTNVATARVPPKIGNGVTVDDLFMTIDAIKVTLAIANSLGPARLPDRSIVGLELRPTARS
jgi:hypothetical protein